MRKIILMMSVSLDGFFETVDRDISWHLVDDELLRHWNGQFRTMGSFVFGRVTHELMAGYWPTADRDPDISAPMLEFAGIWREMPKFVFSRTLTQAGWNTTVIHDVVPEQIAELKAQSGGDIALSGANLAATDVRQRRGLAPLLERPRLKGPPDSKRSARGRGDRRTAVQAQPALVACCVGSDLHAASARSAIAGTKATGITSRSRHELYLETIGVGQVCRIVIRAACLRVFVGKQWVPAMVCAFPR